MLKLVQNLCAFLRGSIRSLGVSLFTRRIQIGKLARIFGGVSLRVSRQATLQIGKNFKIDSGALVSVLSDGKLLIGDNVAIGRSNMLVCHSNIQIGDGTIFAPNVMVYDHDHVFDKENGVRKTEYKKAPVIIGKNCWIGANTVILRGTELGDNCVVGAGCVLKGKFAAGSVIVQKREIVIK